MNARRPSPRHDPTRRRLLAAALALPGALFLPTGARADLVATVPRIKPSIVAVGTYQRTRSPAFQFRGTGFVVGDGQLVATNAHVLPERLDTANMEA
ncbi:MAG TPA: serine protease, partial [Thauera sp.]|nr:serine protease [Thauera sp.]